MTEVLKYDLCKWIERCRGWIWRGGRCSPPSRRSGIDESGAEVVKGERTWKCSSKVGDSRVATRREESFVESDMFGDDGLAALWEPDEET